MIIFNFKEGGVESFKRKAYQFSKKNMKFRLYIAISLSLKIFRKNYFKEKNLYHSELGVKSSISLYFIFQEKLHSFVSILSDFEMFEDLMKHFIFKLIWF